MNAILVTGGGGVIGSALSDYLRLLNYDVIQSGRNPSTIQNYLEMDVTDYNQVYETIKTIRPQIIIHLAATFVDEFDSAFSVNFLGAKNILAAVNQLGYLTRIVLIGSAAEYGLISPEENPVYEDRLLCPVSIYGLTKSWQTNWGLMCAYKGLDVIIARIFNVDAPGLSTALFIGRIERQIQEVLSGKRANIKIGSLTAIRDYVTIEEATEQLLAIMKYGVSGKIYHVASGKGITMRDLLNHQLKSYGLSFDIVDEDPSHTNHRGYDAPIIYADITRTKELLTQLKNS